MLQIFSFYFMKARIVRCNKWILAFKMRQNEKNQLKIVTSFPLLFLDIVLTFSILPNVVTVRLALND